jgi:hypothetical protein
LIGSLLKQAISSNPSAFTEIIGELKCLRKDHGVLKINLASDLMVKVLKYFNKVYICIDALDEFQKHRLPDAAETKHDIKIFLTGRH